MSINKLPLDVKDYITPPGIAQEAVEIGAQSLGASSGVVPGARKTKSVIESRRNLREHEVSTSSEAPDGGGGGVYS